MDFFLPQLMYLDFFFKCGVSLLFGFVIGYERAARRKPAGIKTHGLICLGATILTFLSINISKNGDPGRIAAQIVSGIGFIGAGTIFQSKQTVQGLTSAATVFVSAAIGMMIGGGYVFLSFISVIFSSVLLYVVRPKSKQIKIETYSMIIEIEEISKLETITELIQSFELNILQKTLQKDDAITLHLQYNASPTSNHFFTRKIMRLQGLGKVVRI